MIQTTEDLLKTPRRNPRKGNFVFSGGGGGTREHVLIFTSERSGAGVVVSRRDETSRTSNIAERHKQPRCSFYSCFFPVRSSARVIPRCIRRRSALLFENAVCSCQFPFHSQGNRSLFLFLFEVGLSNTCKQVACMYVRALSRGSFNIFGARIAGNNIPNVRSEVLRSVARIIRLASWLVVFFCP